MVYHYLSNNIHWWISPDARSGRWLLSTGGTQGEETWGSYAAPFQAAEDVYFQVTGNDEWDYLPQGSIPGRMLDISSWEVRNRPE